MADSHDAASTEGIHPLVDAAVKGFSYCSRAAAGFSPKCPVAFRV
jgi:hypothetical protein